MSEPEPVPEAEQEAAVRNYGFLCLTALVLTLLVLLRKELGLYSLLPISVGLVGVTFRWRLAPILTILLLGVLIFVPEVRRGFRVPAQRFVLPDWILCGAALAYVAGHYRLQGMTNYIFPPDDRRKLAARKTARAKAPDRSRRKRAARLVSSWELAWLVLVLPIWAFLAQVCYRLLPRQFAYFELKPHEVQLLLVTWSLGVVLFVAHGFFRYAAQQQMTRREALLYLQDVLWLETRREQQRVSRWLTWARERLRRRKDNR